MFTKTGYNSLGQTKWTAMGYGTATGYADAREIHSTDTIIEEVHYDYDDDNQRPTMTTSYQRVEGSSKSGSLADAWNEQHSRRSFSAVYYDDLGRVTDQVTWGTNDDGSVPGYDGENPPDFDTVNHIRAKVEYDLLGRAHKRWDNAERLTVTEYDDLGRVVEVVENVTGSGEVEGSTPADQNRTTRFEYDHFGRLATRISLNPKGGTALEEQKTRYIYGSPLNANWVTIEAYPDAGGLTQDGTTKVWSATGSDFVAYTYDRMGRRITRTDQRGVEHTYTFINPGASDDGRAANAGQLASDTVTALPISGQVDDYVRMIHTEYDDFGRAFRVTSYSGTETTSTVRNQVEFAYDDAANGLGLLTTIRQANSGAVVGTTPEVGYDYFVNTTGSEITNARLTTVTYPDGREVFYRYGDADEINDRLSRVHEIASAASGGTVYAAYGYLGAGSIVLMERPAVSGGLKLTYDPTGDGKFNGLDRFGRVKEQKWTNTASTPTTRDGYAYAHDASGNRLYRENLVSAARSEVYTHDSLSRLTNVERGTLNGPKDGIDGSASLVNDFVLDALGNWREYLGRVGTENFDQSRTHDEANQIDGITVNVGPAWINPAHDLAGNMVVAPDGLDPTEKRHLVYDAWNRLVEVRVDDAGDPGQPGALVATYRYNGLNHRVRKILWDDADPQAPASTIDYYYNAGWQVVEERVDGDVHAQYLWCPSYIDTPVLRWRDTSEVPNQTLNETLYYTVDANKNVTGLITPNGQVVERYLYDPYGRVTVLDSDWNEIAWSASRKNEILFTGYRYNPETGYYQVRHREFNPLMGRWMQRDPLGYVDGGNLYAGYFVMWGGVDPMGLFKGDPSVIFRHRVAAEASRQIASRVATALAVKSAATGTTVTVGGTGAAAGIGAGTAKTGGILGLALVGAVGIDWAIHGEPIWRAGHDKATIRYLRALEVVLELTRDLYPLIIKTADNLRDTFDEEARGKCESPKVPVFRYLTSKQYLEARANGFPEATWVAFEFYLRVQEAHEALGIPYSAPPEGVDIKTFPKDQYLSNRKAWSIMMCLCPVEDLSPRQPAGEPPAHLGTFNNRTGTEAMTLRPIGVDEFVMDWKLIDELDISKEIGRLQRRLLDDLR
ncbi:MAG: RHS repeat-associated core domain-containing protein [Phycisphaeraceae bacterium]|nr:RHS repeat-associated core domain-containing protein [Phycisphaeraceae bacterium]